ncbi:hypothetical protein D3C85_941940 [compost metagenome]
MARGHRLAAAFQINDRQPAMAEADRSVDPYAAGIRPAQGHGVGHALQGVALRFHVLAVGQPSSDSTHKVLLVILGYPRLSRSLSSANSTRVSPWR